MFTHAEVNIMMSAAERGGGGGGGGGWGWGVY